MNSKDLLAKLLASENITVLRAPVQTASFDIVSRVLTLPQWKEMSVDVEEMLIGHEVGHALFTTTEHITDDDYTQVYHAYLNVCEDVRIEKKIKNKYPGLRKTFTLGYRELNEKDFFDIKNKDFSKMLLIDRINLYYKVGYNCGVKFTSTEMDLVRRVDMTDTMQDVHNIAREIFDYTKQERKNLREEMRQLRELNNIDSEDKQEELEELNSASQDEDDDEDDYMSNSLFDDEDEDEDEDAEVKISLPRNLSQPSASNDEDSDEDIASHTNDAFYRRVEEYADTQTVIRYYQPIAADKHANESVVIGYKTVIAELTAARMHMLETRLAYTPDLIERYNRNSKVQYEQFKGETTRIVNYLVKEFEMRKSATQYKRTQTSKIGQLDSRKLAVYQLTDDLFRRIKVVPDAKNHGMIMLLDWSGSMNSCIKDTIKQVINLAMFCQRAMIPYQVFAFTTQHVKNRHSTKDIGVNYEENPIEGGKFRAHSYFNLLELFSNKMSTSEFNRMVEIMLEEPYNFNVDYALGGTPLNEALLYMAETHINTFLRSNNVEKFSLITLTDGQGGSLCSVSGGITDSIYVYEDHKSYKVKNYMRDAITHKEYAMTRDNHTNVLLNIIRDRYGASLIGFHITKNSRRELELFLSDNLGKPESAANCVTRHMLVDELRIALRSESFASIKGTGHDDLFLIAQTKLAIDSGDGMIVNPEMTSRTIAKQFEKFMNQKKTSRVLLNRFVGLVA